MMRSTKKPVAKLPNARRVQSLASHGIDLMQTEREAILAGEFAQLDRLQKRKIALMEDIEARFSILEAAPRTVDRERDKGLLSSTITLLSRRAEENLRLLENARGGVEAGQQILRESAPSRVKEIGLYSPEGMRVPVKSDDRATSKTF